MRSLLISCFLCSLSLNCKEAREIRLLGLLPMTGNGWIGGAACLPAVQMAIEDINARDDLLADYDLTYQWIDSQCSAGITVYRMFETLHADPPYIMLLGDGCSVTTEATAQVSYLWNLTQFSYGSSSPVLSDRQRFPKFFRMVSPDQKLNQARIDMLKVFNWKKVATINQALEFFSMEHDARIILTSMYEDKARKVLCEAYKAGLYGRKIVWFFVGWFSSNFWKTSLDDVDCTAVEMDLAAEGSFVTGHVFRNPVNEKGLANRTASEFEDLFRNYPTYNIATKSFDFVSYQCYDNIWMSALALNCTDTIMRNNGHSKTLDMFTYLDSDISDVIFDCLSDMRFTGVSGKVVFKNGADPDRVVKIQRIQGGTRQEVGLYRRVDDEGQFEWFEGGIQWKGCTTECPPCSPDQNPICIIYIVGATHPSTTVTPERTGTHNEPFTRMECTPAAIDGIIPRDSTDITIEEKTIPITLYVTMCALSAVGIFVTICFLVFNIMFRKNRFVKLSSPNINNVLLFGCVLCYSTVFFKTTETPDAIICKIRICLFSFGFTITFGALFSKTWRVYRIFTNKKLLRRTIKDLQLLAIIGALVGVVVVVLILWESIGPHRMVTIYLPNEVYKIGNDAEVRPFVRVCRSEYSVYFGWVLYIIQGALLSFGAFLAWETRQVKIEALNDSHEIGLCIYNVVVLSAVGLTLSLLLEEQEILMYGVTCGCLILGTTLTQAIIFIPKIYTVRNKTDMATVSTTAERSIASATRNQHGQPSSNNAEQ